MDEKAKDWNAFFAEATAKSISSRVPADTVPIISSEDGFSISINSLEDDLTHSPFI